MKVKFTLILALILLTYTRINAQFGITNNLTAQQYVEDVLLGSGVQVSNVTFTGSAAQIGKFANGTTAIGLNSGVVMSTGNVLNIDNGGSNTSLSQSMGTAGDANVLSVAQSINPNATSTRDAAVLRFNFVPAGDTVKFRFVFASDEYKTYCCTQFNDAFGFFVTGPNPAGGSYNLRNFALVPGTNTPITISTIYPNNAGSCSGSLNSQYYIQNTTGNTQGFNGYLVPMEIKFPVTCGETYTFKFAVADCNDANYDTGIFLESGSFSSDAVEIAVATVTGNSTVVEACSDASFIFTRPASQTGDTLTVNYDIAGTAVEGTDYNTLINPVVFLPGMDTVILSLTPVQDNITEGQETVIITAFTVNQCGDTIETQGTLYIVDQGNIQITHNTPVANCMDDSVLMTAAATGGFAPYQYNWSNGASGPSVYGDVDVFGSHDYIVTVTDVCGATKQDTVTISINQTSPLVVSSSDVMIFCPNDSVPLSTSVSGGTAPYTYAWSTGHTSSSTYGSLLSNGQADYYVEVTDLCGYTYQDTVTLTLFQTLAIDSTVQYPATCIPDGTAVGFASGFTGIPVYNWSGPGQNSQNQVEASVFEGLTSGWYYLVVTDDVCSVNDSIFVEQQDAPVASFAASAVTGCSPLNVTFTNNSQNASDFQWSFGGGDPSSVASSGNQEVSFTADAVVRLIAIEGVCKDTFKLSIDITFCGCTDPTAINYDPLAKLEDGSCLYPIPTVEVPNIFTPNGDNANDLFFLTTTNAFTLEMKIFNRWGNLMYSGNGLNAAWDGGDAGDGTYFLNYKASGYNNQVVEGQVFFQLVREK